MSSSLVDSTYTKRYINETLQNKYHITNMELLQLLLSYLFIGVCISFLVDISFEHIRKNIEAGDPEFEWGYVERVVIILIWPYAIILLIKGMIK